MTRFEVKERRAYAPLSVVYNDEIEGHCMTPQQSGGCFHLGATGCELHAKLGADRKPLGCRRFPYGLVATPTGGRVTTEHRCPCRTIGERPALSIEDAEQSLKDRAGRLEVDRVAPDRIELVDGERVPFAQYARLEADLIARLNRGERAESVLGQAPFPELVKGTWAGYAVEIFEAQDESAGGMTLAWFGDALLALTAGHMPPKRERPWADRYARTQARAKREQSVEAMWNDWIADEIWMFRWLPWGPFDVARAELATRLAVARYLQRRFHKLGSRNDIAAAEAIMICELLAEGDHWPPVVADIVLIAPRLRSRGE